MAEELSDKPSLQRNQSADELKAHILATFQEYDQNKDGLISHEELTRVLAEVLPGASERDASALLAAIDADKDGHISYEEFVIWLFDGSTSKIAAMDAQGGLALNYKAILPQHFELDIEKRYNLDKLELGEGSYGTVFVGRDKNFQNRKVAVKKVIKPFDNSEVLERLRQEIEIMKELDHPSICKLHETFEQEQDIFLVMELCAGGEIFERMVEETSCIGDALAADIVRQIASALTYAHGRSIAHRDIKPENIVFASRNKDDTHIKVIDWGLAASFRGGKLRSNWGTLDYAAPEVFLARDGSEYTAACDIWSLGVLTYVMLSGMLPFFGSRSRRLEQALAEDYDFKDEEWDSVDAVAKDFIRALLVAEPEKRLAIENISKHPWLNRSRVLAKPDSDTRVLGNLWRFSNATTFTRMCTTIVAQNLGHEHLMEIHSAFSTFDINADGVLTFEEVAQGFKEIFGESSDAYKNVSSVLRTLDLDASGKIDYTEFCAAALDMRTAMREDVLWAAFKMLDMDNSGYLTVSEIQKILDVADLKKAWTAEVCEDVAREIVEACDRDDDGKINFDEWKVMMHDSWDARTKHMLRHDCKKMWAPNIIGEGSLLPSSGNLYDVLRKTTIKLGSSSF